MGFVEIWTLSSKPQKVRIRKDIYQAVIDFLFEYLATESVVSLQRLIQLGEEKISFSQHENLPWIIVQIKNDLVRKQILVVKIDDNRNQLIRLKHRRATLKAGHLHN